MINELLNFLELQKSKFLVLIEEYKVLFDIIFPYDFITPKNEFASLLIEFHHNIFIILFFISGLIVYFMIITFQLFSTTITKHNRTFFSFNYFKHKGMVLEIIWTIVPAVILFIIAVPSFILLYSTAMFIDPELTYKAVGHQWYWKYEFMQFFPVEKKIELEAYLLKQDDHALGLAIPRALLPQNAVRLPSETDIRFLVTSYDVLHSWALPALGVKSDACPGRLNEVNFIASCLGVVVGACSEICGVNHGFMPTGVNIVPRFSIFLT